jgi:hypothetical protein
VGNAFFLFVWFGLSVGVYVFGWLTMRWWGCLGVTWLFETLGGYGVYFVDVVHAKHTFFCVLFFCVRHSQNLFGSFFLHPTSTFSPPLPP